MSQRRKRELQHGRERETCQKRNKSEKCRTHFFYDEWKGRNTKKEVGEEEVGWRERQESREGREDEEKALKESNKRKDKKDSFYEKTRVNKEANDTVKKKLEEEQEKRKCKEIR